MDSLAALAVGDLLKRYRHTIGVAESSAGGLINASLVAVPGASAYYLGGGIVYTAASRGSLLGITKEDMAGMRSASEPFAQLLARRIRDKLGATWGLAETGAAGPTGNRYGDAAGHAAVGLVTTTAVATTAASGATAAVSAGRSIAARRSVLAGPATDGERHDHCQAHKSHGFSSRSATRVGSWAGTRPPGASHGRAGSRRANRRADGGDDHLRPRSRPDRPAARPTCGSSRAPRSTFSQPASRKPPRSSRCRGSGYPSRPATR